MPSKLDSHPSGIRVQSQRVAGRGLLRDDVERALHDLCASTHPMSATGGRFPAEIVARRVGASVGATQDNLRTLESLGLVVGERRAFGNGVLWRTP